MKPTNITPKKSSDPLLARLLAELKKRGTRCGTGAEMTAIRNQKRH